jgi:hypothetical protein
MQRLFSTFPTGRPGVGLLVLRLVAGVSLFLNGYRWFTTGITWPAMTLACAAILVAALLVVGFMTPLAGVLAALAGLMEPCGLYILCISAAIVLLGPGAYALDARVFGRREIVITVDQRRNRDRCDGD